MKLGLNSSKIYKIIYIIFLLIPLSKSWAQEKSLIIDSERLELQLKRLSLFGINEEGGNDRVAFSDYDLEAHTYLSNYLKELGLEVSVDAA